MTVSDAASRPATSSRIRTLRRRSFMRLLGGRQDEQQAAVVVVGRKEVGGRARGQIALRVHLDGLAERPDAPLQHGPDRILPLGEAEAQDLPDAAPDHALVVEAGQLEGAATAADDPALGVADEEGRVRCGVVVVEQLEEEAEAALRAALGPLA